MGDICMYLPRCPDDLPDEKWGVLPRLQDTWKTRRAGVSREGLQPLAVYYSLWQCGTGMPRCSASAVLGVCVRQHSMTPWPTSQLML